MNAVWSFWSKPYFAHYRFVWPSDKHHLLAWVLSLETAKQHQEETYLYTDDDGKRLLVDGLGLRFGRVSTALNALAGDDPEWWALGKIYTYSLQTAPFVHIDNDVFLWKPLPARLEQAPVFAQHPEPFKPGRSHYQPEMIERALHGSTPGWLPTEWLWFRRVPGSQRSECCGIVGGRNVDFIRHYASQSLKLIKEPSNQRGLRALARKRAHMLSVEQYLLAACVEYHRRQPETPFRGVEIAYLFPSFTEACNADKLARAGFTHLMAGSKRNPVNAHRLESQVQQYYAEAYMRCIKLSALL